MQGWHVLDPHAQTTIDLESFVHDGYLLRKVDRILETSFVRELTAACYRAVQKREQSERPCDSGVGHRSKPIVHLVREDCPSDRVG
jgi:hypothetical protein